MQDQGQPRDIPNAHLSQSVMKNSLKQFIGSAWYGASKNKTTTIGVWESLPCAEYVHRVFGDDGFLMPTDPRERALKRIRILDGPQTAAPAAVSKSTTAPRGYRWRVPARALVSSEGGGPFFRGRPLYSGGRGAPHFGSPSASQCGKIQRSKEIKQIIAIVPCSSRRRNVQKLNKFWK